MKQKKKRFFSISLVPGGRGSFRLLAVVCPFMVLALVTVLLATETQITSSSYNDYAPMLNPDCSYVVFDRADTNDDIYKKASSGAGSATQLTGNSADDTYPKWSGTGGRVAFTSDRCGGDGLYVMASTGETDELLYIDDPIASPWYDWKPGSNDTLVYTQSGTTYEICKAVISGASVTITELVTAVSPEIVEHPTWSSDGNYIAYFHGDTNEIHSIYKVSASGGSPTLLAGGTGEIDYMYPCWSPAGDKIFYYRYEGDDLATADRYICVMDTDGTNKKTLRSVSGSYYIEESYYCFNHDGSTIVYPSADCLYKIDVTGGFNWKIAEPPDAIDKALKVSQSSTYPKQVVFARVPNQGGQTTYIYKLDWEDDTSPTVTATYPTSGSTLEYLDHSVTATFSEAMALMFSTDTFTLKKGTESVFGTVSYSDSDRKATFAPTGNLTCNSSFTATVSGTVRDLFGNTLSGGNDYTWSFTTGEGMTPEVISTSPANGVTIENLYSNLTATFNKAMSAASLSVSTFTVYCHATGSTIEGAVSYDSGTRTATFNPTDALTSEANYSVEIGESVENTSGVTMEANYNWVFETADTISPQVTSTVPASSATAEIYTDIYGVFSKEMDYETVTGSNFTLYKGTQEVTGTVSYISGEKKALFVPSSNLTSGEAYECTIYEEVSDLSGNTLETDYTWSFNTVSGNIDSPLPPRNLKASAVASTKIKLEWTPSPSLDVAKYNIYWNSGGTGEVSYVTPLDSVSGATAESWTSNTLTHEVSYTFGVRAEDSANNEEQNTDVVASTEALSYKEITVDSQTYRFYVGGTFYYEVVTTGITYEVESSGVDTLDVVFLDNNEVSNKICALYQKASNLKILIAGSPGEDFIFPAGPASPGGLWTPPSNAGFDQPYKSFRLSSGGWIIRYFWWAWKNNPVRWVYPCYAYTADGKNVVWSTWLHTVSNSAIPVECIDKSSNNEYYMEFTKDEPSGRETKWTDRLLVRHSGIVPGSGTYVFYTLFDELGKRWPAPLSSELLSNHFHLYPQQPTYFEEKAWYSVYPLYSGCLGYHVRYHQIWPGSGWYVYFAFINNSGMVWDVLMSVHVNNFIRTFIPSEFLVDVSYDYLYSHRDAFADFSGIHYWDYSAKTYPRVLAFLPISGRDTSVTENLYFMAQFSKDMNTTTLQDKDNYKIIDCKKHAVDFDIIDYDDRYVRIEPSSYLNYNTLYSFILDGDEIKDTDGLSLGFDHRHDIMTERKPKPFGPKCIGEFLNENTGNVYHVKQDFSVSGKGLPLEITRTYNNQGTHSGPFGFAWTCNYNMELALAAENNIFLVDEFGSNIHFTREANSYTPQAGEHSTLTKEASGAYTLTRKDLTEYRFNTDGQLTWIRDKNQNRTTLSYDRNYLLQEVSDSSDRKLTFIRDDSGRIIEIQDPANRTFLYQYDENGDLVLVTYPNGTTIEYSYDEHHNLCFIRKPGGEIIEFAYDADDWGTYNSDGEWELTLSYGSGQTTVTDQDSNTCTINYDSNGEVTSFTDRLGNSESYTWDNDRNRTHVINALGITTESTFDSNGNVTAVILPIGATVEYVYNSQNLMTKCIDALGNTTEFQYSSSGNLTNVTDPLGNGITREYNSYGLKTSETDKRGNITYFYYDSYGNMTGEVDAMGATTEYTFNTLGQCTSVIDPNGNTTEFSFDSVENLTTITDPYDNEYSFLFDGAGNMTRSVDAGGCTVEYTYDSYGRLTKVHDALGYDTVYSYGAEDTLSSEVDAVGATTEFYYDVENQLTRFKDALNNNQYFYYDKVGNLTKEIDPAGSTLEYTYDSLNRQTAVIDPLGHTTEFSYNAVGNCTMVENAAGITIERQYDALGRQTAMIGPYGTLFTYQYDADGNRTKVVDATGQTVEYAFDKISRVTKRTNPLSQETCFYYDSAGNRTKIVDPAGATVELQYDKLNRVVAVIDPLGNTLEYTYNSAGTRATRDDALGQTTEYSYNDNNWLSTITYSSGSTVEFAYSAVANITGATNENVAFTYAYDLLGRNTVFTNETLSKSLSYSYNPVGNVTALTDPSSSVYSYTYNADAQLTSLINHDGITTELQYNTLDLRTKCTHGNSAYTDYVYDNLDRPTSVTHKEPDNTVIRGYNYTYDSRGNRTKMEIQPYGCTHEYTYDAAGQLTAADLAGIEFRYSYNQGGNMTEKEVVDDYYSYSMFNIGCQLTEEASEDAPNDYFSDDFSGGSSDWTTVSGSWSVSGNVYQQTNEALAITITATGEEDWTDYVVSARVKVESSGYNNGGRIYVRYIDSTNYYCLEVNTGDDKLKIIKRNGGSETALDEETVTVSLDTWYTLKIRASGGTFTGYLDGEYVCSAADSTHTTGKVGLGTCYSDASFDDVRIRITPDERFEFDYSENVGWVVMTGEWSIDQEMLKQTMSSEAYYVSAAGASYLDDYVFEGKVLVKDEGGANTKKVGVAFRYWDDENYYLFEIDPGNDTLKLRENVSGSFSDITSITTEINTEQWYTLRASLVGTSIECWMDGEKKIEASDSSHDKGRGALVGYGCESWYDNVNLWCLPLFEDDFSGSLTGWTTAGGTWEISSNELSQTDSSGETTEAVTGNADWRDYSVEAALKVTTSGSDNAVRLLFRYNDTDNFYHFTINPGTDMLEIGKCEGGTFSSLTSKSFTTEVNTWYTAKVYACGANIAASVDERLELTVEDYTFSQGKAGFGTRYTAAMFDDITVVPLMELDRRLLFSDDFDDGSVSSSPIWTEVNGTWSVANGEYKQTDTATEYTKSVTGETVEECAVEARAKIVTGGVNSGALLVFRYTDSNNYYLMEASAGQDQVAFKKITGGSVEVMTSEAYTFDTGTWYTLQVKDTGSAAKGYVNGTMVKECSLTGGGGGGGSQGGLVGLGTRYSECYFENFQVHQVLTFSTGGGGSSQEYAWEDVSGRFGNAVMDGEEYQQDISWMKRPLSFLTGSNWYETNYTCQAKVMVDSEDTDSGAFLGFKGWDPDTIMYLGLYPNEDKLRLVKVENGVSTELSSTTFTSSSDTWYDLQVEVTGNTVECSVGSTVEITYSDTSGMNLQVFLGSEYSYASFDEVKVFTTEASNPLFYDPFETTYSYDANGCLTEKNDGGNETEYEWDYEQRLTKMDSGSDEYSFKYGPEGQLIEVTSSSGYSQDVSKFLWDRDNVLIEYNDFGSVSAQYTHGPYVDEHLSLKTTGSTYYYLGDALGNVTLVIGSSEEVVEEYLYEPYGADLYVESSSFGGGGYSIYNPYKFTGRREVTSDLYYYRGRWYVPSMGRFISRDRLIPYAYLYCANNPVNHTDPTGLILPSASDGPVNTGLSAVFWDYEDSCGLTVTLPDSIGNSMDYGNFYHIEPPGLLSRSFSYRSPRVLTIPGVDWQARRSPNPDTFLSGLPACSYTNVSDLKRSGYWRLRTWCERFVGQPYRLASGQFDDPAFVGEALRRAGYAVPALFTSDRLWFKRYFVDYSRLWGKQY